MILFGSADKENVAGLQFSEFSGLPEQQVVLAPARRFFAAKLEGSFEAFYLEFSPVDDAALQLFQLGAEWVLSNDAQNEGRLGVGEGSGGPFDELDEVHQVARLDLIRVLRQRGKVNRSDKYYRQHGPGQDLKTHTQSDAPRFNRQSRKKIEPRCYPTAARSIARPAKAPTNMA